ncbi:DUF2975 domain-containing protein [uncultured Chitinophaga sp.]|uniref:DUF2975 domain-containing protein n=1 Tax=uncultured Chitinophaga sp. TaxID=339340 RepID=UPI0025F42A65|nr:DUF2975 domain-containing protein [uncultured Chitinophaga sp.]
MKFELSVRQLLNVLLVLAWIIFIGLSIDAGAFIVNAIFTIVNPDVVKHLWQQADLSQLFAYDRGYYFVVNLIIGIVLCTKAWLFYLVINTLHSKDLDIAQPFSIKIRQLILLLSYAALLIGLFSSSGVKYAAWLAGKGISMPDAHSMRLDGADVWLLMAVILFIIAQIFKRGIEIQTENDLTI